MFCGRRHFTWLTVVNLMKWLILDFRCVGEQAGLSGGVPDRSQSGLLWTHSELPETRTAHHQRRHQPSGYETHLQTPAQGCRSQSVLTCSVSSAGVLEEARFFGIEQLAEQLETLIKVCVSVCVCVCVCVCSIHSVDWGLTCVSCSVHSASWRSLPSDPQGVHQIPVGHDDQVRAAMSGKGNLHTNIQNTLSWRLYRCKHC